MNIEIANRLVKMRKAHGYSQEELAEKLGLSRQAVSKWERAESSPDTDNLIMLSRLYGVSLDELLSTEDEIPTPEPEPAEEAASAGNDGVHVSFIHGINVTDDDGSRVHIGWDGIHVHDAKDGDGVHIGREDAEVFDDDPEWIGSYIKDIEVSEDGVTFTQNGERRFEPWNREENGKKSFVHKVRSEKTGKWRTTVISEDGHKVVLDTNKEPSDDMIHGDKVTVSKDFSSAFPYAVLVTGAFLLLGFLKQWWHPAWVLFLTIPIYYSIENAIRRKKVSALDVIVPIVVTGAYVALGLIYGLWHPLWLMLLAIPVYFAISIAVRNNWGKGSAATGIYALVTVAAYIALGVTFGQTAWTVGWLLFLTVPMFASIVNSIRKKSFRRFLTHFPWELLIIAGYLFVGLMFGIWHPTWVAFIFIPVWRWLISLIAGKKKDSSSVVIDAEDVDDDDDDEEDEDD